MALQKGHRVSIDLDFFNMLEFDTETVLSSLKIHDPKVIYSERNSLSIVINDIKVDFLRHNYPMIDVIKQIGSYRFYSLKDIAAMKINAIINRGAKKDFFDLEMLLHEFSKGELLTLYQRKYGQISDMMFIKSMVYFHDAEADPEPMNSIINSNQVKERIKATFL